MAKAREGTGALNRMTLTVAILDSDTQRRKTAAGVLSRMKDLEITEIPMFPEKASELSRLLPDPYNVVLFNVDCDQDLAFEVAENLNANSPTYVMAYSSRADMKLAVHLMRAGAREFFTTPLDPAELAAAMERAAEHHAAHANQDSKAPSRLFVFMGTKGRLRRHHPRRQLRPCAGSRNRTARPCS